MRRDLRWAEALHRISEVALAGGFAPRGQKEGEGPALVVLHRLKNGQAKPHGPRVSHLVSRNNPRDRYAQQKKAL